MPRQYVAVEFKPGQRPYTYSWDGDPLSIGDRVVVFSRGREQRVSVVALPTEKPPFETKAILRVVDQPPADAPTAVEARDDSDLDDRMPL